MKPLLAIGVVRDPEHLQNTAFKIAVHFVKIRIINLG
jgi:hypothetical protein